MRRLSLNRRLILASAMAALFCGVSLNVPAQTAATTLTPAQQQAKAQALAKQQQAADAKAKAQAAAQARAQAQAAAKAKTAGNAQATTGTAAAPAAVPATARPNTMFTQGRPAPANTAATTAAPSAAAPATAAKPTCGGFFNPCSPSSNGGGAAGSGSSATTDSMNRAQGTNALGAGLGSFSWDRSSVNAYGCLRSGTRVFCDFDEFNQTPVQTNAGGIYGRITMVLSGGRIAGASKAVFVGSDGSTFQTAQLDPNVAVRTMLEYDDIPETETTVKLSFNNKEIQNVAITPMNLQANGNPAPRSSGGGQQAAAPAAGQPAAAPAPQSLSDKATAATTAAQTQKSKWGSVLSQAKSAIGH